MQELDKLDYVQTDIELERQELRKKFLQLIFKIYSAVNNIKKIGYFDFRNGKQYLIDRGYGGFVDLLTLMLVFREDKNSFFRVIQDIYESMISDMNDSQKVVLMSALNNIYRIVSLNEFVHNDFVGGINSLFAVNEFTDHNMGI